MFHVDRVVVYAPLAVLTAQLLAVAGPSRLMLLRNSRTVVVVRIVEASGCLVEGWCVRQSIRWCNTPFSQRENFSKRINNQSKHITEHHILKSSQVMDK